MVASFFYAQAWIRRATVSLSAQVLQQAGLIRYRRGQITVVDEAGLHAAART